MTNTIAVVTAVKEVSTTLSSAITTLGHCGTVSARTLSTLATKIATAKYIARANGAKYIFETNLTILESLSAKISSMNLSSEFSKNLAARELQMISDFLDQNLQDYIKSFNV